MSNITDFQAAYEVDKVNKAQGWSLATYTGILCDFIALNGLWPQVLTYAKERAAEENEGDGG